MTSERYHISATRPFHQVGPPIQTTTRRYVRTHLPLPTRCAAEASCGLPPPSNSSPAAAAPAIPVARKAPREDRSGGSDIAIGFETVPEFGALRFKALVARVDDADQGEEKNGLARTPIEGPATKHQERLQPILTHRAKVDARTRREGDNCVDWRKLEGSSTTRQSNQNKKKNKKRGPMIRGTDSGLTVFSRAAFISPSSSSKLPCYFLFSTSPPCSPSIPCPFQRNSTQNCRLHLYYKEKISRSYL